MPPIPGLAVHALTFKDLSDAIDLRNHVVHRLDLAESDPRQAARQLTFVFVGAGYAGVEALAEMRQLVQDALPHYPALRGVRQRWILIDASPRILAEVPARLSCYARGLLQRYGVDILTSSRVASVEASAVTLASGTSDRHRDLGVDGGSHRQPAGRHLGTPPRPPRSHRRRLLAPRRRDVRASGHSGTARPCPTPRLPAGSTRPRVSMPFGRPAPWSPPSRVSPGPTATAASAKGPRSDVAGASRGSSASTSAAGSAH